MAKVVVALNASAEAVWRGLTEPELVARWLGDLSDRFEENALLTIDLGDGDTSVAEITRLRAPERLSWSWRAFGIGIRETVTWAIEAVCGGSVLTVSTSTRDTPDCPAATDQRAWSDTVDRLIGVIETGEAPARPVADEIEIETELPGTLDEVWGRILDAQGAPWFPLRGARISDGITSNDATSDAVSFVVRDGDQEHTLAVELIRISQGGRQLSLRLSRPEWLRPTVCEVGARPGQQGAILTIRHRGWRAIALDPALQRSWRRRLTAAWYRAVLLLTFGHARALQIPTLTPAELRSALDAGRVRVFDSNRITLWRTGHIPGAVFVGQEEIAPAVLPADRTAPLVFYCRDTT